MMNDDGEMVVFRSTSQSDSQLQGEEIIKVGASILGIREMRSLFCIGGGGLNNWQGISRIMLVHVKQLSNGPLKGHNSNFSFSFLCVPSLLFS